MFDPSNLEETKRAQELNARMVRRAIQCDGTCTGEHGVGSGKMVYQRSAPRARLVYHRSQVCSCFLRKSWDLEPWMLCVPSSLHWIRWA